jgi:hypothetical protein
MNRIFFFLAGLVLASNAQAQTRQSQMSGMSLMIHSPGHGIPVVHSGTATDPGDPGAVVPIARERALLGQLENDAFSRGSADVPEGRIDGPRALLGSSPSALPVAAQVGERPSSFRAEVRGHVTGNASGEAEFGPVRNPDRSLGAFVVSLGLCGEQSAVLFTHRNGTPLKVGRYRVSEPAEGADEIMALVLTGSPTQPTGVYRGESGWLSVTATSERFTAGQFEIDAIGFTAAEPGQEDRRVNVTGSFLATTASSSLRVCENAE